MRTFSSEGIVLKRTNYGEADRIVTVLTKEYGKLSCLAKGVRKMTSTKRGALEPGDRARMFFSRGRGTLPLVTQAMLIDDTNGAKKSLRTLRNLSQVLEILDTVVVEEQGQEDVYAEALKLLDFIVKDTKETPRCVKMSLQNLLHMLGFDDNELKKRKSVTTFIEELSDRKLKSFSYLMP